MPHKEKVHTNILVVYPGKIRKGLPQGAWRVAHRLKSFSYLSDEAPFNTRLCGMRLTGIIIEEGVRLRPFDVEYFLTRLWTNTPNIMLMSEYQKQQFEDAIEGIIMRSENTGEAEHWGESILGCITVRVD